LRPNREDGQFRGQWDEVSWWLVVRIEGGCRCVRRGCGVATPVMALRRMARSVMATPGSVARSKRKTVSGGRGASRR
jgi:hypothetical protein